MVTSYLGLVHGIKHFLAQNFDMKDIGKASYVISIEIHTFGLSQKAYVEKVLERFRMKNCVPTIAAIVKGDTFN